MKSGKLVLAVTIAVTAALVTACGGPKRSEAKRAGKTPVDSEDRPIVNTPVDEGSPLSLLEGTWTSPCVSGTSASAGSGGTNVSLEINGHYLMILRNFYTDWTCKTPDPDTIPELEGYYALSNEVLVKESPWSMDVLLINGSTETGHFVSVQSNVIQFHSDSILPSFYTWTQN